MVVALLLVLALVMLALEGRPLLDAALTAIGGLNSSAFVAVLFFVVAAKFMESGGIARVLIEAAEAWVGRLRGGLGLVAVVGTMNTKTPFPMRRLLRAKLTYTLRWSKLLHPRTLLLWRSVTSSPVN